ncbi:hypothetical protein, partial [Frankia sp. Cr2]|uniref:hypothetical protein n=1 Tax=Frankia sp. Cr2 TaxID=3073932 RepID=UPI002AD410D9
VYSFGLPGVAVVPASWADGLPTGAAAQCSLPDHTRFTETGSSAQYVSVRGAALPLAYSDAVAYDAEGLRAYTELPVGYLANPIHAPSRLPKNTVIRAVGTPGQYLYVGGVVRPIGTPTLSACLLGRYPQNGVAVVPASWLTGVPRGAAATCT